MPLFGKQLRTVDTGHPAIAMRQMMEHLLYMQQMLEMNDSQWKKRVDALEQRIAALEAKP